MGKNVSIHLKLLSIKMCFWIYTPLHVIHIYNRYTELHIQCTFDCNCPVVKDSDDLFASAQYPSPYVLYNIIQAVYKIPGTIESVLWES